MLETVALYLLFQLRKFYVLENETPRLGKVKSTAGPSGAVRGRQVACQRCLCGSTVTNGPRMTVLQLKMSQNCLKFIQFSPQCNQFKK